MVFERPKYRLFIHAIWTAQNLAAGRLRAILGERRHTTSLGLPRRLISMPRRLVWRRGGAAESARARLA